MENNNMGLEDTAPKIDGVPPIVEGEGGTPPTPEQNTEPSPDHPRFKEIYGKWKQMQRENEELILNQKRMLDRLNNFEKNQFEVGAQKHKERMEKAIEEGDTEKFKKAFEDYEKQKENFYKSSAPEVVAPPQTNKNVELFKKFNPWFEANKEMTDYALKVNDALKADPYWSNPKNVTEEDFLAEVAKQTNAAFPGQGFVQQQSVAPTAPTGGVGSSDFSPSKPTSKTVQLTDAQKSVARKLFSNEEPANAYKLYSEGL